MERWTFYALLSQLNVSPTFFYLPNLPLPYSVLWVHLWGGLHVLWLFIWIQSSELPGWNILASIYVSINLGWVYFVYIHVLIISFLEIIVTIVLLMETFTLLFLFWRIPTHNLLLFVESIFFDEIFWKLLTFIRMYLCHASGAFR